MITPKFTTSNTLSVKCFGCLILLMSASVLLSACTVTQTVSQVMDTRAIQDDFDAASRLQVSMFGNNSSGAVNIFSSQENTAQIMQVNRSLMLYQRVINGVNSLGSQKAELLQNGLWASLQTLKAMSQWQIGDKEAALITANQAIEESQNLSVLGRDMILLNALPSLVANDEAFEMVQDLKITRNQDDSAYQLWQRATALYDKAEKELSVIIDNSAHSELQFYLQLSRLMVVTNWENSFDLDLCGTLSDPSRCDQVREEKIEQSKIYFEDLLVDRFKLSGSCDAVKNSQYYAFWLNKIGTNASSKASFKTLCPNT